jgi:hypothetical protein
VDWGQAVSWSQIEEYAGLTPDKDGKLTEYVFNGKAFRVTAALVDSGYEAKEEKSVYDFCTRNAAVFSPSKGGGQQHLRGNTIRTTPVWGDRLELVWYWDDWFKHALYYDAVKEAKTHWWIPTDTDEDYRKHMTAERTVEKDGKLVWMRHGPNHLADTEKMHEVLRDAVETELDWLREAKGAEGKK